MDAKDVCDVLFIDSIKNWLDVRLGVWDTFSTDHSLENLVCVSLSLVVNDSWAVNQVNSLSECDILPHLCLTGDWSDLTASFLHQRVDYARFSNVWITNKADRDALLLLVKHVKLLQKLNERTLAEWVSH